jgi:predicted cation transporter
MPEALATRALMSHIPDEPVLYIVLGLCFVTLLVLSLPFAVKKVEENLELFFLIMGALSMTISGLWSWEIVLDAIKAPVLIGSLPIGIFQVVLIFGLLLYFFNKHFCNLIMSLAKKLGGWAFVFLTILILGIFSSVISVIVTAVLFSEILSALPIDKKDKIKFAVIACFAFGLGAGLTPIGEPLSTILVSKLAGPPYNAGFFFPLEKLGIYIIPGIIVIAVFGAFYLGKNIKVTDASCESMYSETLKTVILRALRVYMFVAALILLGEGLKPLIIWFFTSVPSLALYWINMVSAILDNATLTAIEIGPNMHIDQIICILLGLLISGGMLIPGNIPNIVAAGRLKINMKEWAIIGVPIGLILMTLYFIVLLIQF